MKIPTNEIIFRYGLSIIVGFVSLIFLGIFLQSIARAIPIGACSMDGIQIGDTFTINKDKHIFRGFTAHYEYLKSITFQYE